MDRSILIDNPKVLLIIGNGFDLDMGLKTSYEDFFKSEFFISKVTNRPFSMNIETENLNIFDFLQNERDIKGWIDLEGSLAKLAQRKVKAFQNNSLEYIKAIATPLERSSFQELRLSLAAYLKNIDYGNIRKDCTALRLLEVVNFGNNTEVISFNYTDLESIFNIWYGGMINFEISYIHGSLNRYNERGDNPSIILGIQDEVDIDNSYSFMIKSHSEFFRSYHIKRKLAEADIILFFGHSLGPTDYSYFSDFFSNLCIDRDINEREKLIRIFTYNEASREDILNQLRTMNKRQTKMLYENNNFCIYRTDGSDNEKIKQFLGRLRRSI